MPRALVWSGATTMLMMPATSRSAMGMSRKVRAAGRRRSVHSVMQYAAIVIRIRVSSSVVGSGPIRQRTTYRGRHAAVTPIAHTVARRGQGDRSVMFDRRGAHGPEGDDLQGGQQPEFQAQVVLPVGRVDDSVDRDHRETCSHTP